MTNRCGRQLRFDEYAIAVFISPNAVESSLPLILALPLAGEAAGCGDRAEYSGSTAVLRHWPGPGADGAL